VINRLIRWAMWSPAHLATAAGCVVLILIAVAFVFRPSADDSSAAASITAEVAAPQLDQDTTTEPATAAPTHTVAPADGEELGGSSSTEAVDQLYRGFTTAWLTGLGALSRPAWVVQVCTVGCTPYLRQMLGTTTTSAIPDAKLKRVRVDQLNDSRAIGRVQLSDKRWLKLTADWDGERWVMAGIESA